MFVEVIRSEGLSHLSYLVGAGDEAAVIDPRRDCGVYRDLAYRHGVRITRIVETHRNEDYVVGSRALAELTGAEVVHGAALDFEYGTPARDGDVMHFGEAELRVLETPGHTDESIALALYDTGFSAEEPVGVFTGDTLFIGATGRTDLTPHPPEEAAARLYDSLHRKILPLGDQAVLYPAHGAGSVCGSGMADREVSTLGFERRHNPELQLEREAFIRHKAGQPHERPPYFRRMEHLNRVGAEGAQPPAPAPYPAERFAEAMEAGMLVLDVRSPEAVAGALLPGSLALPLPMLSAFAGWFVPYQRSLGLVADSYEQAETAARQLARLGYDEVSAYLDEGLHGWEMTGRQYRTVPALHAAALKRRQERDAPFTLLDVRSRAEVAQQAMHKATHIYLGELPERLAEVPPERPITTFCGSGQRAVIAASILLQHGFDEVEVCLGSLAACKAVGCPME